MGWLFRCTLRLVVEVKMTREQALENLLVVAKEVCDGIKKSGRVEAGSVRFMDLQTAISMVETPEIFSRTEARG